jgi:acyl-CoA synthetase (AMP-forming)/AMP-acid ligase II
MGLIAAFILPLVTGTPLVIMSPFAWVRQPVMLLHAITRHHGTLVWLPNFAYNFLATRIRDAALEGVDLSSLRALINCSEPVYAESHRAFMTRFAPYGFRETALATCYAMAENTFAVTQSRLGEIPRIDVVDRRQLSQNRFAAPMAGDSPTVEVVSCGAAIPNCEIRVVGESGDVLPDRRVGEITLRSDSMLTGYYRRDDLAPIRDGWYLTGDMGYVADGELYITGRKKDLIIVGGKNVYPQDIENLLNDVPGVHPGRVVAFGIPNPDLGTEDVAVLVEADSEDELHDDQKLGDIMRAIRGRIATNTEVTARYVEVLAPRQLIKTSSGKIARTANRERFLERLLP